MPLAEIAMGFPDMLANEVSDPALVFVKSTSHWQSHLMR